MATRRKSAKPKTTTTDTQEPATEVNAEVVSEEDPGSIVPSEIQELTEAVVVGSEYGYQMVQGATKLAHGAIGLYSIVKQIYRILKEA
jgi:hypothetical protein